MAILAFIQDSAVRREQIVLRSSSNHFPQNHSQSTDTIASTALVVRAVELDRCATD
jgi:hypothetical protein